jgi:hypothetical protein
MAEDKPEEESKPEENKPKTAQDMVDAANTFIKFLKKEGFSVEEGLCALALANSLAQVDMMMQLIIKDAKVMAIPVQHPGVMVQKPSDN